MARCLVLFDGRASLGPYGIDKLADFGYELVEVPLAETQLHRKLRDVAEHRLGVPLDKTLRSAPKVPSVDVVLAFLERQALAPSWLKVHRIPPFSRKPLAMLACWLADELRALPADDRRDAARRYAGVDLTMVWSTNQIDILFDSGFDPDRVEAISFGFAPGLFPFVDPLERDGTIAAIGSDRGRDYPTLLEAVRGTDLAVDLYCRDDNLEGAPLPDGVRLVGIVPFEKYRAVLRRVGVVAVPTKVMAYPTGQTVALEAAASGAAVVLTDTPAMREYFPEGTALFAAPGDQDGWRNALRSLRDDPDLRTGLGRRGAQHVRSRYTYRAMWREVDQLFRARGWVSEP
ncbi:glycosyltransferase family protein [Tessaracoccus sp. Z1128]